MSKREPLGAATANIVCPYCQIRGYVTGYTGKRKKGISGGKATGAIVTLGASLLVTGLSRKEKMTHLHCGYCQMEWDA